MSWPPMPPVLNNHLELVYRPGERALTKRLFELLGRKVVDNGRPWMTIDDKRLVLSEVTPEQWAFEQKLSVFMQDPDPAVAAFVQGLRENPHYYFHFGLGVGTLREWETLVQRVRDASIEAPELRGRVQVASVFRPGDPGAIGDDKVQAFVRTDVFSAGLLTMGQTFEIQHFFEFDKAAAASAGKA